MSALSSLIGGFSELSASREQQALYDQQARLQEEEGQRDAAQRARDVTKFQAEQGRRYLNSGVTLEGTPLLMLEETRRLGQQEVDAIVKQSKAQAAFSRTQGRMAGRAGRNAMFGSVFGALGGGLESYLTMRRLGMFGQPTRKLNPAVPLPPTADANDFIPPEFNARLR